MLSWTYHPILPIPSDAEMLSMGPEKLSQYHKTRESAIRLETEDPFRHGYEPSNWKLADDALATHQELLLMGGNRAAKTEICAKRVVQALVHNPNTVIWCLTENMQNSIQVQQKAIFKYLPKEYKKLGRSSTGYVVWSLRNGFTAAKFSLPNSSQCIFRNWSQDLTTIEGGEIGVPSWENGLAEGTENIGYWADELIPLGWLETIRYRCITRGSKGLISFTAVTGWSPTVKSLLSGAVTTKWGKAELLDDEPVPLVQQPTRKSSSVVYFHTKENKFGGWEHMKKQLDGESRDTILCRAYGVPTRAAKTVFKNFSELNVKDPEDIPILADPANNPAIWVTTIDPAGAKPWYVILVGIDAHGVHWLVDEFPRYDLHGLWFDPAAGDHGKPGDGARSNGFGIGDYVRMIKEMEGDRETIRYIDPRLGASTYQKAEGTSNIIDDLAEHDMIVHPAEGLDIETGLQAIQNLLAYDTETPIDRQNKPRLMISSECRNTIVCMEEWVNDGNSKHPGKDPIDCLRYHAISNAVYFERADMVATQTGGY